MQVSFEGSQRLYLDQSALGLVGKVLRPTQLGDYRNPSHFGMWTSHVTVQYNSVLFDLTFVRTIEYIEVLWFGIHCLITDLCVLWCARVYMCLSAGRGQRMTSIIFHLSHLRQSLLVNPELVALHCGLLTSSPGDSFVSTQPLHLVYKCVAMLRFLNGCSQSELGPHVYAEALSPTEPSPCNPVWPVAQSFAYPSLLIGIRGVPHHTWPFGASWDVWWLSRPMRQSFLPSVKLLSQTIV